MLCKCEMRLHPSACSWCEEFGKAFERVMERIGVQGTPSSPTARMIDMAQTILSKKPKRTAEKKVEAVRRAIGKWDTVVGDGSGIHVHDWNNLLKSVKEALSDEN